MTTIKELIERLEYMRSEIGDDAIVDLEELKYRESGMVGDIRITKYPVFKWSSEKLNNIFSHYIVKLSI